MFCSLEDEDKLFLGWIRVSVDYVVCFSLFRHNCCCKSRQIALCVYVYLPFMSMLLFHIYYSSLDEIKRREKENNR